MRQKICNIIRKKIVTLEYPPGHRLNEQKLAQELGVSRTPVREALILLSSEGLVTMAPNVMTHVSEINLQKLRELTELRLILEQGAARLAAANRTKEQLAELEELAEKIKNTDPNDPLQMMICDTEFHRITRIAANNSELAQQMVVITNQFTRVMYQLEITPTLIAQDIPKIVEAIRKQDPETTAKLITDHVNYFMGLVRKKFDQGLGGQALGF
ncbi:MAG: GntR family transcriptional regulator [Desulfuromonadales bacterium]|nr:GntR family transcriptional regulator [Desulfuromonadales bacterium]